MIKKKKWLCMMTIALVFIHTILAFGQVRITNLSDMEEHWIKDYKEVVYLMQHLGIIAGYPDQTFKPQNNISRGEFVKMVVVALGESNEMEKSHSTFQDVLASPDTALHHWSHPYVEVAVGKGIIFPEDYGTLFKPNTPITRLEIAVMVVRALGLREEGAVAATGFIDDGAIPSWAKKYIHSAVQKQIIQGYKEGDSFTFKPENTATRAEATLILHRFLNQKTQLKRIGYYAIDSFNQANQIELGKVFDEVAFGWSALEKKENGEIVFSMTNRNSDYKKPVGYQQALALASQQGVKKKLMLTETNTSLIYSFLENKKYQQTSIQEMMMALEEHGLSGIVMDFENIRDTNSQGQKIYKNLYTAFLRDLKEALNQKGYSLSVTVQPNNVIGHYDGYDFKAISEIADELNIMAHDYHERNNLNILTDHAPFHLVHQALTNVLKEGVDPQKIILGLQVTAGTQWVTTVKDGYKLTEFHTPAMSSVYNALREYSGTKSFNYQTMTPTFRYTRMDNQVESQRIIRYEDDKSIESKLILAKYYGIKGVSFWRIGEIQEDILQILHREGQR